MHTQSVPRSYHQNSNAMKGMATPRIYRNNVDQTSRIGRSSVLSRGKRQGLLRVSQSSTGTDARLTLGVTATDKEAQTE